jgi:phenylacetate-coenzyme A ligase PaaK-like adenylate-forming protein
VSRVSPLQAASQTDRTAAALDHALTSVPFYRREWAPLDPGPSRPPAERLAALPVLSKRDLRAHVPRGFMPEDRTCAGGFSTGEIEMVATSGTAEERLSVVWHQPWWDLSEREAARIHPVLDRLFAGPRREAVLTSPVCAGNTCHFGETSMEERTLGPLLFLNQAPDPALWDEAAARRMAGELASFVPDIIEADPAYLGRLAQMSLRSGIPLRPPSCIVLTYEFPSRLHRRWIERAFPGVPVVSSYGSTETGHVFTQCAEGAFHQNTATCHVEVQPLRAGLAGGGGNGGGAGTGRLLVTTLGNPWFVLLRFDIGDLVRPLTGSPCPCGRTEGLTLAAVEGRTRDLTFDTRGRAVTVKALDDTLAAVDGITGYQLRQAGAGVFLLGYTAEGVTSVDEAEIREALHGLYGADAAIEVRGVAEIAAEQSGKLRLARADAAAVPGVVFP